MHNSTQRSCVVLLQLNCIVQASSNVRVTSAQSRAMMTCLHAAAIQELKAGLTVNLPAHLCRPHEGLAWPCTTAADTGRISSPMQSIDAVSMQLSNHLEPSDDKCTVERAYEAS